MELRGPLRVFPLWLPEMEKVTTPVSVRSPQTGTAGTDRLVCITSHIRLEGYTKMGGAFSKALLKKPLVVVGREGPQNF